MGSSIQSFRPFADACAAHSPTLFIKSKTAAKIRQGQIQSLGVALVLPSKGPESSCSFFLFSVRDKPFQALAFVLLCRRLLEKNLGPHRSEKLWRCSNNPVLNKSSKKTQKILNFLLWAGNQQRR